MKKLEINKTSAPLDDGEDHIFVDPSFNINLIAFSH